MPEERRAGNFFTRALKSRLAQRSEERRLYNNEFTLARLEERSKTIKNRARQDARGRPGPSLKDYGYSGGMLSMNPIFDLSHERRRR
jgi:hypothetical protein